MPYCKFCGKKLEDGEICTCIDTASAHEKIFSDVASNESGSNKEKAAQVAAQSKAIASNVWKEWLELLKAPTQQGPSFVQNGNPVTAVLFIVLQAIFAGLFAVIFVRKINGLIGIGGMFTQSLLFSGGKAFFLTLLYSIILSALLTVLYFLSCKVVRKPASLPSILRLTSMRSVISIPVTMISILLSLLNVPVGLIVFYFVGMLASAFFLHTGFSGLTDLKPDRSLYLTLIVLVLFILLFFLFASMVAKSYVPAAMKGMGSLNNLLGNLY